MSPDRSRPDPPVRHSGFARTGRNEGHGLGQGAAVMQSGKAQPERAGYVRTFALGTLLGVVALLGCDGSHAAPGQSVDNAALSNEADGTNWAAYGRTFSEQHYSPLREINASNVS